MRFRAPLALALFLSAVWVPPAGAQEDAPWPVVGRTPSHAAVADGPTPPYRVAWEIELESGPPVAGPVVGDGMLVVVGRSAVSALDPGSGDELWSVERAEGTGGAAAVAGDLVLFVEGGGEDAALVAVDAADGEETWRTEIEGHAPGGVIAAGQRAYVASRGGTLYAVELEDGSVAWTFPEEPAGRRFESIPAVSGDLVLVSGQATNEGTSFLDALDRETGERRWSYRPEGVGLGISSPSEEDGLVVAGTVDGRPRAGAFETKNGLSRWSTDIRFPFSGRQMPIVTGDVVVIADAAGHVYRLDRDSGEVLWTFRVPGFLIGGSPSIIGDAAVVGDLAGQVSAIDLESGLLVWKQAFGDDQVHPIAADGERLYVAARDGTVAALEHDSAGRLLEEPSPTTLFLGRALLNYGAAFAIVGGALALLGLLWRTRS